MSDLLSRLQNDKDFAKELQELALTVRSPDATDDDVDKFMEMLTDSPEQLEALRASPDGVDPRLASITITTITTLTTATTAF